MPPLHRRPLALFGIEIRIDLGWILIALWIAWALAAGDFPRLYKGLPGASYGVMAILAVLGLGVSIVLHELAHSLVGRLFGVRVDSIRLFLLGGVAELHDEPKTATAELLMALAGPLFSMALALVLMFAAAGLGMIGAWTEVVGAVAFLGSLNLILAIFNLLPAFPLDGGRVLRGLIWLLGRDMDRATLVSGRVSRAFAVALIGAGVIALAGFGAPGGLSWILVGVFLYVASGAYLTELEIRTWLAGRRVAEVMSSPPPVAPGAMSVDEFVARGLHTNPAGAVLVSQPGRLCIVEAADLLAAPPADWGRMTLADIARPLDDGRWVGPADNAAAAFRRLHRPEGDALFVLDNGTPVGVLTLRALLERMAMARRFDRAARRPRLPARPASTPL